MVKKYFREFYKALGGARPINPKIEVILAYTKGFPFCEVLKAPRFPAKSSTN